MSLSSSITTVVLHLDAVSLRYLGCYGNEWVASPAIDRLAHEGMVFDHCFAPLDLLANGIRVAAFDRLLAEWSAAGVRLGWGSSCILARCPNGAAAIDVKQSGATSLERLLGAAGDWLKEGASGPGVLWLDIGLAPSDWSPDADLLEEYLEDRTPFDLRGEESGMVEESIDLAQLDSARDTYAARVATLDRRLGLFFDRLREAGVWDSLVVVLSAEQGWPLGEHDSLGWARPWVHGERDHVPLVLKLPGASGGRSASLVTPADLGPTMAELMGVAYSGGAGERSLAPILRGESSWTREYLVGGLREREFYLRTMFWKLILPVGLGGQDRPRQLYAQPEDRFEVNEMAEQKLDVADHLELHLWRYLDALARGGTEHLPPLRKDVLSSA